MSPFSRPRSVGVRTAVAVVLTLVCALALWWLWIGGYDVTSTYGSLGGGWWMVLLALDVVLGLALTGLAVLALRFLGLHETLRWVAPLALVVSLGAGFSGAYAGSLQHAEDQRVTATSCDDGMRATMDALADAVRTEASPYIMRPTGSPSGCRVDITVPRSVAEPLTYVDERTGGTGFRRTGETTWSDEDGTTVTVRVDRSEEAGKEEVFVILTGLRRP